MSRSKRREDAADQTRASKSRDKTRPASRSRRPAGDVLLQVACALDLETGTWPRPLSSEKLGEANAKAIVTGITRGIGKAERLRRGDLATGVLEVQFEYRGDASRLTRVLMPKVEQAIGEFLSGPAPKSDHRRLEGTLIRLQLWSGPDFQSAEPRRIGVPPVERRIGVPPVQKESRQLAGAEQTSIPDPTLHRLAELITHVRRLSKSAESDQAIATLQDLQATFREIRQLLGHEAAAVFNRFAGQRYDLETSKAVASLIDQTAKSLGLHFAFTASDGIERLARLRCQATGRDRQPTFQFQSTAEDGTRNIHAASRTLPRLTVRISYRRGERIVSRNNS